MSEKPYIYSLIDNSEFIKRQFIHEKDNSGQDDPLQEESFRPVPTIIHRFDNRVLFLLKYTCPVICAFCTRKRLHRYNMPTNEEIEKGIEYIKKHKMEEVIFSGGEPLWNEEDFLINIMDRLKGYILRIHTRMPLMMPEHIYRLKKVFQRNPYVVVHFNHPDELSKEVLDSVAFMKKQGAMLFSQSVLLKNVNDTVDVLYELFYTLYKNGVKPYYLHQLDESRDSIRFKVDEEKGKALMKKLSVILPGLAMPVYVKDIPFSKSKKRIF